MRSLLIVEDDVMIRNAMSLAISRSFTDLEVKTAGTLVEAAAALAANRFDVVTLDLNIPGSEGVETIDLLRDSLDQAGAQVLVVTGLDDADTKDAIGSRGVTLLTKPFGLQPLIWEIREMLNRPADARKTIAEAQRELDAAIVEFSSFLHARD